jgi:uncharacterized protein YjcR
MKKQTSEDKNKIACTLYISGLSQKDISERLKVSEVTIGKWAKNGRWKELRAAKNVTRAELINKILLAINLMLDEAIQSNSTGENVVDKLAKFAGAIEKLDKKITVVDLMESLMAHSEWLQKRMANDKKIDINLFRRIIEYHDLHVSEAMGNKIEE